MESWKSVRWRRWSWQESHSAPERRRGKVRRPTRPRARRRKPRVARMRKFLSSDGNLSTGTPGSGGQDGPDSLSGQIGGGSLNRCAGRSCFDIELRLSLADFFAGCFAGGVESCVSFRVPLFYALFAELVDVGAGQTKALGILGSLRFGLGNRFVGILHGARSEGAAPGEHGRERPLH